MKSALPIGDFARATQLSVKTLRHYHRVGLLEPADVDAETGYRYYRTEQIPTAQVIKRFRALDMPLEQISAVIGAADVATRNALLATHLSKLEAELTRTQQAVASLRGLLDQAPPVARAEIRHRQIAATPAAAISEVIDLPEAGAWYQGALGELRGTMAAHGMAAAGSPGGVYANELFTEERGLATLFVPAHDPVRRTGRVKPAVIPAVELAVIVHPGRHDDIDLSYGALAGYVTEHALAVDGPIREYYLVGSHDAADAAQWRTEIGWPIFSTGSR
jgi:DNA-binding transcriptional MerR regulator